MQVYRRHQGFSLIELMIAIVISAILATVAYPIYATYQARGYRLQAEVVLMQLAVKAGSYRGIDIKKLENLDGLKRLPYRFQLAQVSDSHFLLQAVPNSVQQRRDQACGTLGIADDNNRYASGSGGVSVCWSGLSQA